MVSLGIYVTPTVILAALSAAVVWGLITWWFRDAHQFASHALLGGYAGAAMANSAFTHGIGAFYNPIIVDGWIKTLLFIVLAPALGMVLAQILMKIAAVNMERRMSSVRSEKLFGHMQLASSACLSLMHGSNDAQKTAGIIASALVTAGYFRHFHAIPVWVLWASYGTMGLGTLDGGWRIVRTLGHDLTRLKHDGGFCAETAAAAAILCATLLHLPVSTTHVTTGAIVGVGAARSLKAVRWDLARKIFWAWIFTIPSALVLGASAMGIARGCAAADLSQ